MAPNTETPHMRAYLLRFWEVRSRDPKRPACWRFSLEDPHTGDRLGFADLAALVTFLETELANNETQVEQ